MNSDCQHQRGRSGLALGIGAIVIGAVIGCAPTPTWPTPTTTTSPTITIAPTTGPTITAAPTTTTTVALPGPTALNGTGVGLEADYCTIQFPSSLTVAAGVSGPMVFGQVYEGALTPAAGPNAAVTAQLGIGPAGSDPATTPGWTYVNAGFNVQVGNNDEYQVALPPVAAPGTYSYVYRFSFDNLASVTYCDLDGAGSNPGLNFSPAQLGPLTVTP